MPGAQRKSGLNGLRFLPEADKTADREFVIELIILVEVEIESKTTLRLRRIRIVLYVTVTDRSIKKHAPFGSDLRIEVQVQARQEFLPDIQAGCFCDPGGWVKGSILQYLVTAIASFNVDACKSGSFRIPQLRIQHMAGLRAQFGITI